VPERGGTTAPGRVRTRGGGRKPGGELRGRSAAARAPGRTTRTRTPNSRSRRSPKTARTSRRNAKPPTTRHRHSNPNRLMQHSRLFVWGTERHGRSEGPHVLRPTSTCQYPKPADLVDEKSVQGPTPDLRAGRRVFVKTGILWEERAGVVNKKRAHPGNGFSSGGEMCCTLLHLAAAAQHPTARPQDWRSDPTDCCQTPLQ
jgi:hypothetical protein